ncbi:MAG TPA: hypothetical protein VFA03_10985 [Acetobacteraceae bacterium]|nr:hypothetical protein [Acetobacteraceae bacterium]
MTTIPVGSLRVARPGWRQRRRTVALPPLTEDTGAALLAAGAAATLGVAALLPLAAVSSASLPALMVVLAAASISRVAGFGFAAMCAGACGHVRGAEAAAPWAYATAALLSAVIVRLMLCPLPDHWFARGAKALLIAASAGLLT